MKKLCAVSLAIMVTFAGAARAQTAEQVVALKGLAPFAALLETPAGQAALKANLATTEAIQNGTVKQPLLLSFQQQQAQALRDAYITAGNGAQLADGLGTTLGGVYAALAGVTSTDDGKTAKATNISPANANLLAYSTALTGADSNSGKYFFADGTQKSGKGPAVPASAAALAIFTKDGGTTDVFGKAYSHPAGSAGADPMGDSRPFQTDPGYVRYSDADFWGVASGNTAYLTGPAQDLTASPAFPSGHTTYGYTESLLFALMVPERYQQMVARGAEYGNDRIILAAHYAMDVIGGRTLALYDVAHLLANDPRYLNRHAGKAAPVANFQGALAEARGDLRVALAARCGATIAACAAKDAGRFRNPAANAAFYEATQTYGLPVVYPALASRTEDVGTLAPEAGYLLTEAFPNLTLAQADRILTATEGPGGGFLDNGSAFGVYSRLDLYKAAGQIKP